MVTAFPDRHDQFFGREPHVQQLTQRASGAGLTVVVGRPLMGKSWTLTEVARRLLDSGCLVGYHESKAAETSHLLYAVSDLYAHWLADSTMQAQAISLWERHKGNLVPRVGQMVGGLFQALAQQTPLDGVAAVIRSAFHGLAEAQQDLLSGGLQIAPLPYDQALSLIEVVAQISKRRVVLILDAWEKSPSMDSELATLEAFLKHQDAWPTTHIFVAIRDSEMDSTRVNDKAYQRARDLCRLSPAARVYDLVGMDQRDPKECARMVKYVRDKVPAAAGQPDGRILELIDGYPGVLYFWADEFRSTPILTAESLEKEAGNAHAVRYFELGGRLGQLGEPQRTLAAYFAVFPRLNAERWEIFRDILLNGQSDAVVHSLLDDNVLNDEGFPTYGHDTRHAAARTWFIEHRHSLIRRVSGQIIESLASRVTGVDRASLPFVEALFACSETVRLVGVDATLCCLLDAAQSTSGDISAISSHEFDDLYPKVVRRNGLFASLVATALVIRGAAKGRRGDIVGTIADCTAAINLSGASLSIVAQALVNRGTAKRQRNDAVGAITDYAAAIALPGAPAAVVAVGLVNRGAAKARLGDTEGAIADCTAAIDLPGLPPDVVAQALVNRGGAKGQDGDSVGAIRDCTEAIELPGVSNGMVAEALINRGTAKSRCGDTAGAIDDYTSATVLPYVHATQVAQALVYRGGAKVQSRDIAGAITDCTTVIESHGVPAEITAQAFVKRGSARGQNGDTKGAIADCTAAIELRDAPVELVAEALVNRGTAKSQRGDIGGAISDRTAAIELPDISAEMKARALFNRGAAKARLGDMEGTIADCTAAIDLPGVPPDVVAQALVNRGVAKQKCGDTAGAIVDYETAIKLPGAPPEIVAHGLRNLSVLNRR